MSNKVYTRNQIFKVYIKANTFLTVVAISEERCKELAARENYAVEHIQRIGNAHRGISEGICN